VPGVIGAGVPSLSQVYDWDTAHLHHAAAHWPATAERWEESFAELYRGTLSPGGTVWRGQAADAFQERAFADLAKVRGLADSLHEVAAGARRGAQRLDYLKREAIDAIRAAQAAGFDVGDDLSVTSRVRGRDVVDRHHAETIAARVVTSARQIGKLPRESPLPWRVWRLLALASRPRTRPSKPLVTRRYRPISRCPRRGGGPSSTPTAGPAMPAIHTGEIRTTRTSATAAVIANGDNNLRNDWMPDGTDFIGGSAAAEFVHLTYPGE
jgi:hypothetical protein